jgi:hypothetical protein
VSVVILSVVMISIIMQKCHSVECRDPDCRGAATSSLVIISTNTVGSILLQVIIKRVFETPFCNDARLRDFFPIVPT